MSDEAVKCDLCAVPLAAGVHEALNNGKRCHATCLIRSLRGTVSVLEGAIERITRNAKEQQARDRELIGLLENHIDRKPTREAAIAEVDRLRRGWRGTAQNLIDASLDCGCGSFMLDQLGSVRSTERDPDPAAELLARTADHLLAIAVDEALGEVARQQGGIAGTIAAEARGRGTAHGGSLLAAVLSIAKIADEGIAFSDRAVLLDASGKEWTYSAPADVWHPVTGELGPGSVALSSARSYRRLAAEFGPLTEAPR